MLVNFFDNSIKSFSSTLPLDQVAVIILGGGEGTRLAPLTKTRCKPAVSFGGRYSLIDIPISHSMTSGLSNIYVIGQYLAGTLRDHLYETYLYHGIQQEQIHLLIPEDLEYEGTADAVRKNLHHFSKISAKYFLILSGDQLYNINFQKMIEYALKIDAGMLVASQPVNKKDAKRMGLLKIEQGGSRLLDFYEKPQEADILSEYYTDAATLNQLGYDECNGKNYLGSMGIYLFKREVLFNLLKEDPRDDFGKHLIKTQLEKKDAHAFLYDGYWEDIGTIESYYEANLALTGQSFDSTKGLLCYNEKSRIITKHHSLPGPQISHCEVKDTLICEGSILEGQAVDHCVLGVRSLLDQGSIVRDSILLGNEYYKSSKGSPGIGKYCHIERAIIDENVTIGNHVHLVNQKGYDHYDSPDGYVVVRDGIIIIPRGSVIPDNYYF